MSKNTPPAIRFAIRQYRIFINWAALSVLKKPVYLQFLFKEDRKILAISGSDNLVENSFKIPERVYKGADEECCINRMALTEAFRVRMNWDKNENYRVIGEYVQNINMVVFDLTTAAIVGKNYID
jgi:hypothetical protein